MGKRGVTEEGMFEWVCVLAGTVGHGGVSATSWLSEESGGRAGRWAAMASMFWGRHK